MSAKTVITPLTRMLAKGNVEGMLTFLNQFKGLQWWLMNEGGVFRAEIDVNGQRYLGTHQFVPAHALAHAISEFLMDSKMDFHEYMKEGSHDFEINER